MSQILEYRDCMDNKNRRIKNALINLSVDIAGYCSYAYQRRIGMSVKGCKAIMINGWSDAKIDEVEAVYQGEIA